MFNYKLTRYPSTNEGTFGTLCDDSGEKLCRTVELPWLDNEPDKSCISEGVYVFVSYLSPEHGKVWKAQDVPGRTNIEIHAANFARQLLGCIGVGDRIGTLGGLLAVLNSDDTLDMLRAELPDSFTLTIVSS